MTENMDTNFEQLLAAQNKEFAEAKEFDDFTPPPGDYVFVLKGLDKGTYQDKKTDTQQIRISPELEIIAQNDDSVDGRSFRPFFSSKAWGSFKTFAREALGGNLPNDLKQVISDLKTKIGTVYEGRVEQNGNFTNVHLLRELESSEDAEAEEEEATEGSNE